MDRVRYLRLTVAVAVAVALAAAVGMSLVRSAGEKVGDHTTTPTKKARETGGKATFAPTGTPGGFYVRVERRRADRPRARRADRTGPVGCRHGVSPGLAGRNPFRTP
jgi:hypothetical protein